MNQVDGRFRPKSRRDTPSGRFGSRRSDSLGAGWAEAGRGGEAGPPSLPTFPRPLGRPWWWSPEVGYTLPVVSNGSSDYEVRTHRNSPKSFCTWTIRVFRGVLDLAIHGCVSAALTRLQGSVVRPPKTTHSNHLRNGGGSSPRVKSLSLRNRYQITWHGSLRVIGPPVASALPLRPPPVLLTESLKISPDLNQSSISGLKSRLY